jgi:hypothetical protein
LQLAADARCARFLRNVGSYNPRRRRTSGKLYFVSQYACVFDTAVDMFVALEGIHSAVYMGSVHTVNKAKYLIVDNLHLDGICLPHNNCRSQSLLFIVSLLEAVSVVLKVNVNLV